MSMTFEEFLQALEWFCPGEQDKLCRTKLALSRIVAEKVGPDHYEDQDRIVAAIMGTVAEFARQHLSPARMDGSSRTRKQWCYLFALEAAYFQYLDDEEISERLYDYQIKGMLGDEAEVHRLLTIIVGEDRLRREKERFVNDLVCFVVAEARKRDLRTIENWRKAGVKRLAELWDEEERRHARIRSKDAKDSGEYAVPSPSLGSQPDPYRPPSLPVSYIERTDLAQARKLLLEKTDGRAPLVFSNEEHPVFRAKSPRRMR